MTVPESVNDVRCRRCKATAGDGCLTPSGNPANEPHAARVDDYWKACRAATAPRDGDVAKA